MNHTSHLKIYRPARPRSLAGRALDFVTIFVSTVGFAAAVKLLIFLGSGPCIIGSPG